MKLGIMQPYFFPYLGYFDLINYTDFWIVFDNVQYIRHGWINRNRVLKPGGDWQYITVPLKKHSRTTSIKDIEISQDQDWKNRIYGQLQHYKKKAPFYDETCRLLEVCFSTEENIISRLNIVIIETVCDYLGITFRYDCISTMNIELESVEKPGDWALFISEKLNASEYVNPPGGKDIFDSDTFKERGINLNIRQLPVMEYTCRGVDYIPNLSIIDILMWNSPSRVKEHLEKYLCLD